MHANAPLRDTPTPSAALSLLLPALGVAPCGLLGRRLLRGSAPSVVVVGDGTGFGAGSGIGSGIVTHAGLRVDPVGVPAALLDVLARFGDHAAMAVRPFLEPGGLSGLRLGLGLGGAGAGGGLVGEGLPLVHLRGMRRDVLANAFGLHVPMLVASAPCRESQRRDDDDGDDRNDYPDDSAALHGGSFHWKPRVVVDAPGNSEFPTTRLPKPGTGHTPYRRFGPTLTLTYSTRPTTSCVGAPSRDPSRP